MAINYFEINAKAVKTLLTVKQHTPLISPLMKALIELRVSQINGCSYCVDLHSTEAVKLGETQRRLNCVVVWSECGLFSSKEIAAFKWAETLTLISENKDIEVALESTLKEFSEAEIVDLTIVISLMNGLNRLAIGMGDKPKI